MTLNCTVDKKSSSAVRTLVRFDIQMGRGVSLSPF
ncbi:hypothetical protein VPHD528_0055 [Vibrio phage D528]